MAPRSGGNGFFSTQSAPSGQAHDYGGQSYGRQLYGEVPSATVNDPYPAGDEARGYSPNQPEYQDDSYEHAAGQHAEEEYYDDVPSSRRRLGVMAIAGIFALAVVGTAGAFGYRAIFGSSSSSQPPPVIKADTGPSKIVPATTGKDSQSNKLITDRMNERGQSERLVSREEQPVDKPTAVVLSQPQSALGNGVIGSEPKKIRTIAIHPDQPAGADPVTPARATAAPLAPPVAAVRPSAPPARTADNTTADAEQDTAPAASAVRAAPPARQPVGNAPLSLNPNVAPAPVARAPAAPTRTASVAPQSNVPAASASAPGNYVQLSSQRSEAEAQAAFRSLQAKFPTQLGSRTALIHKVELGAKGTYYRAMVGPFANANEAGELCSSLKAAGGQCLIQRN